MAGTWTTLNAGGSPPPNPSTMLLLMDGSVLCQNYKSADWYRLTPQGDDYNAGSWARVGSTTIQRLYFASAVMRDGQVLVVGGEYSNDPSVKDGEDSSKSDVFDPDANKWSPVNNPFPWIRGDAACCMLADGRIVFGSLDTRTAIYDPASQQQWSAGPAKGTSCNEETWTLLPDGSVLTVECFNLDKSKRFVPSLGSWVDAADLPVRLVDFDSSEIGPALLLPDGRVFAIGATGHTAFYTPPTTPQEIGAWFKGPDLVDTNQYLLSAMDAPGVLLPNGRVLCIAGYKWVDSSQPDLSYWSIPTLVFEIDPTAAGTMVVPLSNAPAVITTAYTYQTRFLLVPHGDVGQVLCTVDGSAGFQIYTPDSPPIDAWRPIIQHITGPAGPPISNLKRGNSFTVTGLGFNGLSQAVSYGDDYTAATNYPIGFILIGGQSYFCKMSNPSTMGVATGNIPVTAQISIPALVPVGPASLYVIANGIRSAPFAITVVA